MVQFWRMTLAVGAMAAILWSCSGQNLEGAWFGPFPYPDADACRIRLYDDNRFDLACGQDEWVGAGKYERTEGGIRFLYIALARRGALVRQPEPVDVKFTGHGNRLELAGGGEWVRKGP
jgi:hypothetical protein